MTSDWRWMIDAATPGLPAPVSPWCPNNPTVSYLPISGGTLTGPLILARDPVQPLEAATREYVDALLDSPAFTGIPTAPTAAPTVSNTQLATTAYVHAVVATGGTFIDAPADGTTYGRRNNNWSAVLPTGINVKSFGAKGDNTQDDTAAIQAAVNSLGAAGGSVYIPAGHYRITTTIYLPSNTHVYGDGDATWLDGAQFIKPSTAPDHGYAFFSNLHWSAATLTDSNISIEDLRLDYNGSAGPTMNAGDKCIAFVAASNLLVSNVSFYAGSATGAVAQDGVAFMRCQKTWVVNCRAFNFMNCPYDWWDSPRDAWLIDCYAETGLYGQTQIVCFNPENTAEQANGSIADGFTMTGCTFVGLGSTAVPAQLEPLLDGNICRNMRIANNLFRNVGLYCRRNTSATTISDNVFTGSLGGGSVISANVVTSDRPDSITITGNTIINPDTTSGAQASVFCNATNSTVADNTFSGGTAYNGVFVGTFAGTNTWGNVFPSTSNGVMGVPAPMQVFSPIASNSGISLVNAGGASSADDLTKHIAIATGAGLNFYNNAINVVVPGADAITWRVGGTQIGYINASGINGAAIGQQAAAVGTFAPLQIGSAATGPTITQATGAPSGAPTPNTKASLRLRTDGTSGSLLYIYNGSTWDAVGSGSGTITGVTAGTGLTGGGSTGTVTVSLSAPVTVANGGTGASTAGAALTALGAAPLASPTFTGTVTIPAGASISGYAPLASPAFSGTPSLPTGTTGVTQSVTTSNTALATTAYVATRATTRVNVTGSAANSATTTSNPGVMCGFAVIVTPAVTGILLVNFAGTLSNTVALGVHGVRLRYGTGSAPTAGQAATGTQLGQQIYMSGINAANVNVPFATSFTVTGLTIGTAYWFDLQQNVGTTGTGQIWQPQWAIVEL